MVRLLCRYDDGESELYYAGGWQNGSISLEDAEVLGLCRTPRGSRPDSAASIGHFRENVAAVASEVRWFEEVL
jgi:hypothetical protein